MRLVELPATDNAQPLFAPDSAIRRIHQEGILLLGGGRSLLMQLAHPLVARGVAEHSSYRADRVARLLRTVRSTLAVVYGTREQAVAATSGINRLHQRVNGEGYSALDPDLLVWVLATLIDSTIVMHETFIGPISSEDAESYYDDACRVGTMLFVPEGRMPPTLEAMQRYVEDMSSSLTVSDDARTIAAELLAPLPGTGPAMLVMRHLTAGLLHPHLREGFGLDWGPMREAELRVLQSLSRSVLQRTPLALRRTPAFLLPPH